MSITLTGFRQMDLIDWVLEGRGGSAESQSIIGDAHGVCQGETYLSIVIFRALVGPSLLILFEDYPNLFSQLLSLVQMAAEL